MKNIRFIFLLSLVLMFCSIVVSAQTIVYSFTGRDADDYRCNLSRVIVTNLSKNWQEILYGPDTLLILNNGTGVSNYEDANGFMLSQNTPNPFNGSTDVIIQISENKEFNIDISDMNGKIILTKNVSDAQSGTYTFRVQLSSPQTYVLTVRQAKQKASIKMVNNGMAGKNAISLLSFSDKKTFTNTKNNAKGVVNRPWSYGDNLVITGYADICGTEYSTQISKQLLYSETITLYFEGYIDFPYCNYTNMTNITATTAMASSSVSSECEDVLSRGFCYKIYTESEGYDEWGNWIGVNPTLNDMYTIEGGGSGSFTSTITGLEYGQSYRIRSYAIYSGDTAYGETAHFQTHDLANVVTGTMRNVTTTNAVCNNSIISYDESVLSRGICWSTTPNPTLSNMYTIDGSGTGSFNSNLPNLVVNTTYYVRAYATCAEGVAYGNEIIFSTLNPNDGQPCTGAAAVTDIDNNTYNTVQIGTQCWMKENLRTTRQPNGQIIPPGNASTFSVVSSYRYMPGNDINNVSTYGYLYNQAAVMNSFASSHANPSGVQGICPNGWHVPSRSEWAQLYEYVKDKYIYSCGNSEDGNDAKAIASPMGWATSTTAYAPGNTPSTNNLTGFSALPAGHAGGGWTASGHNDGGISYVGYRTAFWGAEGYNVQTDGAWVRCFMEITYDNSHIYPYYNNNPEQSKDHPDNGNSVRCVRN